MKTLEDRDIIIGWCKTKSRDIDEAMLDSVKEKRLEQSRVNHSPTERTYHGYSKKHSHSNDSFQQKNDRH